MLKYYKETENDLIVQKVFQDGSYTEISASSPEVVSWLAEGNSLANDLPSRSKEEDEVRLEALLGDNFISGHHPTGLFPADLPNS